MQIAILPHQMSENHILVETHAEQRSADIVVGVPSYNEADSIGFVIQQAAAGLHKYFPHQRTVIVNADNFSEDGTKEVFLQTDTGGIPKVYLSTPPGIKGKGNNFKNLFGYLSEYKPKGLIVVDADLKSIEPWWIGCLGQAILEGHDFAAPLYCRNEYDGTITNHVCYPLFYGLLGMDIRQPIGGDFAFSGRMMEHWLSRDWTPNTLQYGVDIFMTTEAVLSGFSVAQVDLGSKIHKPQRAQT